MSIDDKINEALGISTKDKVSNKTSSKKRI